MPQSHRSRVQGSRRGTGPVSLAASVAASLFLTLALALAGCSDPPETSQPEYCPGPGFRCPCASTFGCPGSEVCVANECVPPTRDGGDDAADAGADVPPDVSSDASTDASDASDAADPDLADVSEVDEGDGVDALDLGGEPDADLSACVDDRFDQRFGSIDDTNDRPTNAASIEEGSTDDLVSCPGDEDWFALSAPAHSEIVVDVFAEEPLNVALWNRAGIQPRGTSETIAGGHRVRYQTVAAVPLALSVENDVTSVLYTIEYEATRVPCDDDEGDDGAGDDTREDATPVTSGAVVEGVLCDLAPGEEDWYALDVLAGHVVSAVLSFRDYDPELAGTTLGLRLYRGDESSALISPVASSAETSLESGVLEAGRYYLSVRSQSAAEGAYDLRVLVEPSESCDFDTVHEEDGSEPAAAASPLSFGAGGGLADDLAGLVLCEDDSADIFAFPLDAHQRVTVEVELNDPAADLRVQVYGAGVDADNVPTLERAGDVYRTSYSSSADGLHYVRIEQGAVLRRTFYELRIQRDACTFDDYERNDTAAEAYPIVARTFEDLSVDFCEGDQVDWYSRQVFAHRSHAVRVENNAASAIAYGLFRASDTTPDGWCSDDAECSGDARCLGHAGCVEPLAPGWVEVAPSSAERRSYDPGADGGTYLLAVEARTPATVASYSLRWVDETAVCPVDDAGSNHSQANAMRLDPVTPFPIDGLACRAGSSPEDDYYELELAARTRAAVLLTAPAGDLIEVRDCANPSEVLASSSTGSLVYVVTSAASPELSCFIVRGTSAQAAQGDFLVPYELTVGFSDDDAGCGDDPGEPNETDATATPLAATLVRPGTVLYAGPGHSACGADRDAYSLTVGEGDRIRASAFHGLGSGDVTLELRGPCLTSCPLVTTAQTPSSPEVLEHVVEDAGRYIIAVERSSGTGYLAYDLIVEVESGCSPDAFEPNDEPFLATDFGDLGSESVNLCAGGAESPDVDWYSTYLAVGDTLTANAFFDEDHGNVDLFVLFEGAIVDDSTGSGGVEAISYAAPVAGTYQLGVAERQGRDTSYRLVFDIDTAPCDDDAFEDNNGKPQAVRIVPGYYGDLVYCPRNEDWYSFDVQSPSWVEITLDSEAAVDTDDFLVELYQPSVLDPEGLLWQQTTPGKAPDLLGGATPLGAAGTYYLRVRQRTGSINSGPIPYDLTLGVSPLGGCPGDRFEPNDSLEEAYRVDASSAWSAISCDVDWYELSLFAGQDVSVSVASAAPAPGVAILDAEGTIVRSGTESLFVRVAESGAYYLRVTPAASAEEPLAYHVEVERGAADNVCDVSDPGEDDDNRGTAIRLRDSAFGELCDAVDFHRLTPADGEDVSFDIVYDPTQGQPTVDIVGASSDVLASAMPVRPGVMAGAFVWGSGPNAYLQVRSGGDYSGPYRLSSSAYGVCTPESAGERNNTIGAASEIGIAPRVEAICHAGDVDFYEPAGAMGASIRGLVEVLDGDVEVTLYDPTGEAVMVSNGSGPERPKETVWADTSGGGVYRLGVRSADGAPASYEVRLIPSSPSACVDSGGNRTYDSAFPLELGEFSGTLVCRGEGDWYLTPTVPSGTTLRVVVSHDSDLADLDVELYRSEDEVVAAARSLDDDEIVEFTQTGTGPLRVRVFVDDGSPGTLYSLILETL